MQPLTILKDTPLNLLFVAINHYVSTGDHLGEGFALPEGPQRHTKGEPHAQDKVRILILVNLSNKTDIEDYEKFRSRFNQLAPEFKTRLENMGKEQNMQVYSFVVKYEQVPELTQKLTEKPGPLGWGSMKDLIDKHFPG